MGRAMLKVMAATAVFGLLHSALAGRTAKRLAARSFGERNRNGLYRVFYLAQSVFTFGILAAYIRKQPSRELYRVNGPLVWLMRGGQAAALFIAIFGARQIGILRILGWESLVRWFGDGPVPAEPEAQGPALDSQGLRRNAGPFAWSRHPLNFAPVPILWLQSRMTTNLLAFNIAATLYLIVGSLHEETRLQAAYGEVYSKYRRSGVSYYFPWPSQFAGHAISEIQNRSIN